MKCATDAAPEESADFREKENINKILKRLSCSFIGYYIK